MLQCGGHSMHHWIREFTQILGTSPGHSEINTRYHFAVAWRGLTGRMHGDQHPTARVRIYAWQDRGSMAAQGARAASR
jgi:hypothetical protein